jgi:hypothetical protein
MTRSRARRCRSRTPSRTALTREERDYILDLIERWLARQLEVSETS